MNVVSLQAPALPRCLSICQSVMSPLIAQIWKRSTNSSSSSGSNGSRRQLNSIDDDDNDEDDVGITSSCWSNWKKNFDAV